MSGEAQGYADPYIQLDNWAQLATGAPLCYNYGESPCVVRDGQIVSGQHPTSGSLGFAGGAMSLRENAKLARGHPPGYWVRRLAVTRLQRGASFYTATNAAARKQSNGSVRSGQ